MKELGKKVITNPNAFTLLIVTLMSLAMFAIVMLNSKHIPLFDNQHVGKFVKGAIAIGSIIFVAFLGTCMHTCLSNNATQDKFTQLQEANIVLQQKIENIHQKS